MEELEQAKKIIEDSQNIAILPSPDFQKDSFVAGLALFYSLKKLGKNVNLIFEDCPEKFKFLIKKERYEPPQADFLISIKEVGIKLLRLFYEKTEEGLNLYLKTDGGTLQKENIKFQPLSSAELLITLGIKNYKKIENYLEDKPPHLHIGVGSKPDSLINIDNQLENENYGKVNLIELHTSSLSEIVFDLLDTMDKKLFDIEVSNSLLFGIIEGTAYLRDIRINSETLKKIGFLIKRGGKPKELISKLFNNQEEAGFLLFGRVLDKINISKEHNLGWTLLEKKDFLESETEPSNLRFSLSQLALGNFPFKNFLILWENESSPLSVRGVFYSPNKKILEKVLNNFEGLQKGNGILFKTKDSDLEKIKEKILEIIPI